MEKASAPQLGNKALVQASFERWKNGTGGPFELLAPDVEFFRRFFRSSLRGYRGLDSAGLLLSQLSWHSP